MSVVHRDQFLLFGGYDGSTWLNDTHAFDFKTRLWAPIATTGQVPSIRSCPSWCKEGSKVYVFGGYDGQSLAAGVRCTEHPQWRFRSRRKETAQFTLPPTPSPLSSGLGVRRMNDFFVLDLDTFSWAELPCGGGPLDVPSPRYFHACAMHGGRMYTFGGYNGSERLNDMYSYDLSAGSWHQASAHRFDDMAFYLF